MGSASPSSSSFAWSLDLSRFITFAWLPFLASLRVRRDPSSNHTIRTSTGGGVSQPMPLHVRRHPPEEPKKPRY
ncbi:MAG: hypothetical protein CM15mP130_1680 [Verrucomicrobiota bacterium]|nr:MAG: hypothetical protein CM15mP130_1680 [Verrucomicrobiota bacterium]